MSDATPPNIGIGSTVWRFDENYRVYQRNDQGRAIGGPIWREHWRPVAIVGETTRSWITSSGDKVPKKNASHYQWAFSEDEIAGRAFVHEHGYAIGRHVGALRDYATLKAVADLISYRP